MFTRVDDKGKIFTQQVNKRPVPVIVFTNTWQIKGNMHILPDRRLKDDFNTGTERFVAVTEAELFSAETGKLLYRSSVIVLNKDSIVMVMPNLESTDEEKPNIDAAKGGPQYVTS